MFYEMDAGAERRLEGFLHAIGEALNNKKRREAFAIYAIGLLGSAERKSAEPIAAQSVADPEQCDACHQRLLHFLGIAEWDDRPVRKIAAAHAIAAMTKQEPL